MTQYRFILTILLLLITKTTLRGEVSSDSDILQSSQTPLTALYGLPETNICGVNVINGDYNIAVTDFYLPGSNPLFFQRSYCSGSNMTLPLYEGWSHNQYSIIKEFRTTRHKNAVSQGALTGEIPYKLHDRELKSGNERVHRCKINQDILRKGVTNCGGGEISGRTNLKNSMINLRAEVCDVLTQFNGDGSEHKHESLSFQSPYHYLTQSYFPNGCTTDYFSRKTASSKMNQYDWHGNPTQSLSIDMPSTEEVEKLTKKDKPVYFNLSTDDGRKVTYQFTPFRTKLKEGYKRAGFLTHVTSTHSPAEEYHYKDENGKVHRKLKERRGDSHKTSIQYYAIGDTMHIGGNPKTIDSKKHIAFERVKQINVAVDDMEHPERKCWFAYKENKKEKTAFTDVRNYNNNLTRYNYSTDDYRLRTIERYKGNCPFELYRVDRMRWGSEDSKDESNLITRAILDGQGSIQFAENYHYDDRGNVIRKTTHFDRITTLDKHSIDWSGKQASGGEIRTLRSEFNALNLPVLETDDRVTTKTSYLERHHHKRGKSESTSLVSARLRSDAHRIFSREFFDYDQAIGCTLHIVDDGCGTSAMDMSNVKKRVIIRHRNKTGLFAGLPLESSTFGWDNAACCEKLLKKVEFEYDSHGFNTDERHYDSDGVFRYLIQRERDIQGNITFETNALGEPTTRIYDKYGCLIREQSPCREFYLECCYDLLQRPIKKSNIYSDGLVLTSRTSYNLDNLPIKEEGVYGECTIISYNEQQLPETVVKPSLRLEEGLWESPKTKFTYDIFGHLASETNPSGTTTYYQHSPEGKPLLIQHPDGTTERFCYSIYGELIEKIAINGSKSSFTHDSQGRVIREDTLDANGALLKSHTFNYDGSLLASEKDGDLVTRYEYDHAGRVIRKQMGSGLTEYVYDALGRQDETRVFFGDSPEEYISYKKEYDLLNHVLAELEADSSGKIHSQIHYTYDERGNETSVTRYTHAGTAVTRKCYDPRGHLCSETDPLGNTTRYIHHYHHQFEGHTLPCVEKIDPTGVKTLSISDHHGNLVCELIYSPFGHLISQEERFYDINGNLSRTEHVLPEEKIKTKYEYDDSNRLVRQTNGAGTSEELTTRFTYNSCGELCETVYSDGTSKFHSYDGAGRLSMEWSSDQSIVYRYTYDQQDNPIQIDNERSGNSTKRVYTPEGYLLSETFENGLSVGYSYDKMGRVITFTYPDGSSLHKTYNPNSLIKIERHKDGNAQYEIHIENFDLSGTPNTIQFSNNSALTLEYDLLNRPIEVCYPQYTESNITYDSRGQLTAKTVDGAQERFEHDDLMQLTLEQTTAYTHAYKNDAINRQIAVDGIAQIHNAVHQLIHGAHGESVFDKKGRRISDASNIYAYDMFDRLQSAQGKDKLCHYTYDAFNRKMSRACDGTICYYIYDGSEEIGSYDNIGKPLDTKILADGEGSLPISVELGNQNFTPLITSQGHIVGLVDQTTGICVSKSPVTMFGCDVSEDPRSPWRFCGKRHESALGIIDFGNRHYHPKTAQWLTQDPIGDADGPNLYAYVHNNPTRCVDKFGLFMDDFNFSESWGNFKQSFGSLANTAADYTYRSPRFAGGAQAVGGLFETSLGASSALASGGVGAIPGCMVMAHGIDHFYTGCRQMYSGEFETPATVQALTAAGMSPETAHLVDAGISIGGSAVSGMVKPALNKFRVPRHTTKAEYKTANRLTDFIWTEIKLGNGDIQKGWSYVGNTIERIKNKIPHLHKNDGIIFKNRENLLPCKPEGYYKEFVHPTPGVKGAGPQRIVTGAQGEVYYTPDHYKNFSKLNHE